MTLTSSQIILKAARSPVSVEELRILIDYELDDRTLETDNLRLAVAADLLCDAAHDLMSQISGDLRITKMVEFDSSTKLDLSQTAIYSDLQHAFGELIVTDEELHALSRRGSVASVIAKAVEAGETPESLAGGSIRTVPLRASAFLEAERQSQGIFRRILSIFRKSS